MSAASSASGSRPVRPSLWGERIEPWSTVAQHVLTLDWTVPKAFGGRFLTKPERDRLKAWTRGHRLSDGEAAWLRGAVSRAHLALTAYRGARTAA